MVNPVFPLRVAARLLGGEWSGSDGWNLELGKPLRLDDTEKREAQVEPAGLAAWLGPALVCGGEAHQVL